MSTFSRSALALFFGCCLLSTVGPAGAQCSAATSAYDGVAVVKGNPFQAEKVVTPIELPAGIALNRGPQTQLIARDGDGRVRVERPAGKFDVKSGPDAGSQVEQVLISICDTVKETLVQLDTLHKTATIRHSQLIGRPSLHARSFCDTQLHAPFPANGQTQDLGEQTIAGVEARGVRTTMQPLMASPNGVTPGETVIEKWCSDEIGAIVLQTNANSKTGQKSSDAMQNLQRQEPDPALFQIPPDYTVDEAVEQPRNAAIPGILHSTPTQNPAPNQ